MRATSSFAGVAITVSAAGSSVIAEACQGRSKTRPAGRSKNGPLRWWEGLICQDRQGGLERRPALPVGGGVRPGRKGGRGGPRRGGGGGACASGWGAVSGGRGRSPCRSRHPAGWDKGGTTFGWQAFGVTSVCFLLGGNFPRSSPGCGRDG